MVEKFNFNKIYDDALKEYIDKFGHEPIINRTFGNTFDKLKKLNDAIENNTPLIPVGIETDVVY
ncbi:hypothetical protein N9854_05955 [Amylibacter sp.]|nr:hypothetical protein [Amylibacter sp.]